MSQVLNRAADALLVPVVRRVKPLRRLALYVARTVGPNTRDWIRVNYEVLRRRFIENGADSKWDRRVRAELVDRFEEIDANVPIGTTPTDGLYLAEALLSLEAAGALVECGCYAGGSTAKLSILARLLGRELHVFDSFEGLPEMGQSDRVDHHVRQPSKRKRTDWLPGMYGAGLEAVRENVSRYGEISPCHFHKGWFAATLTRENLPERIGFAFTDVDLPSSARECLAALWPRLDRGAVFFSHDVAFLKVVDALLEEALWREVLGQHPPVLFGAGFGLGDGAPYLGFMVKGAEGRPDYVKRLNIVK
jgi:predicted O-methyltransferase YrrM